MKVLFAVDGSEGSLAAVRQVGQLLAGSDSAALYFAPPEVIVRHADGAADMQARAVKAISEAVFEQAQLMLPDAVSGATTNIVAQHTAREGILLEAEKWGADLVALGARGLSTLDRLLLGSVSQSVAQSSKLPVYVARPNPEHRRGQPLRVLFAYDGSACCTEALRAAQRFTFPPHTQVLAMTVVEGMSAGEMPEWLLKKARDADTEAMAQDWMRGHEDDKRQARDQLAEFMAKQTSPFDKAEIIGVEGHAAEQILKLVESRQVDLVIVGSRGRGMLGRLLVGGTSDKVLAHAPCSVLIVRAK